MEDSKFSIADRKKYTRNKDTPISVNVSQGLYDLLSNDKSQPETLKQVYKKADIRRGIEFSDFDAFAVDPNVYYYSDNSDCDYEPSEEDSEEDSEDSDYEGEDSDEPSDYEGEDIKLQVLVNTMINIWDTHKNLYSIGNINIEDMIAVLVSLKSEDPQPIEPIQVNNSMKLQMKLLKYFIIESLKLIVDINRDINIEFSRTIQKRYQDGLVRDQNTLNDQVRKQVRGDIKYINRVTDALKRYKLTLYLLLNPSKLQECLRH